MGEDDSQAVALWNSGTITLISFSGMSKRLRVHLEGLILAKP